jgi:hypothetical protein
LATTKFTHNFGNTQTQSTGFALSVKLGFAGALCNNALLPTAGSNRSRTYLHQHSTEGMSSQWRIIRICVSSHLDVEVLHWRDTHTSTVGCLRDEAIVAIIVTRNKVAIVERSDPNAVVTGTLEVRMILFDIAMALHGLRSSCPAANEVARSPSSLVLSES